MFLQKFSDILFSDFNIIYNFLFQSKIFLTLFKKNISKMHPKSNIGTVKMNTRPVLEKDPDY